MIERPEAVTLARQIGEHLKGARVVSAVRENSPHKWAFYNRPREDYETIPVGKRIGEVDSAGSLALIRLEPGYIAQLGDGGARIALLDPDAPLPKKYHLLWEFEDGRKLTVSVQGWGALRLLDRKQFAAWEKSEGESIDPASSDFTYDLFRQVVEEYCDSCDKSVKAMLVSRPRIHGIGNGYLQDILHRAGLHPARKVREIAPAQRRKLFQAIRGVLTEAIKKGGRDDELDLFGKPGRYVRTMDRRSLGKPCPRCGAEVTKMQYYGGTCYVCPACQPSE